MSRKTLARKPKPIDISGRLAVSIAETAQLSGLSPDSIRGEIARGRLRAVRVGAGEERGTWIVPVEALKAWLAGGEGGSR
jgi:hypothetical protein